MPRALLLACLLLPACLVPPPAVSVQGRTALVRAEDEDTARRVAAQLDTLVPAVAAQLDAPADVPVEVWVQEHLSLYALREHRRGTGAFYVPSLGRIHLDAVHAHGPVAMSAFILAHELVHQMRDATWAVLDPALEEGLADLIGCRVAPEAAHDVRVERLLAAVVDTGGLPIRIAVPLDGSVDSAHCVLESSASFVAQPEPGEPPESLLTGPGVPAHDYGRAFLVLERLDELDGLAGLRAAAVAAAGDGTVTFDEAARMGDVPVEPETFARWAAGRVDAATLRVALTRLVDGVADELARRLPRDDGDPRATFLAHEPVFRVDGGVASVRGTEVAGLLEAFVARRRAGEP